MLYAKIVVGLPVEGPFDYIVPANLSQKIKIGARVWINFRMRKVVGYVVKLTKSSEVKNLKAILEIIDELPILDKNTLLLTKEISDYYCCSWGEAIESALPEDLRNGKRIPIIEGPRRKPQKISPDGILIHDLNGRARWNIYLKEIREALEANRSVIVTLPDIYSVLKAKETISNGLGIQPAILYRKQPQELKEWIRIKESEVNVIIGSRSSIFTPLRNLGLLIIDEEQDPIYKQDQMPHYNVREVAFMRRNIEKAKLILGSSLPSLESFYLVRKNKIKYKLITRTKDFPEIKIINTQDILSKYLIDQIILSLSAKEKILLFLNRKGYATFASCYNCRIPLKCPRCNINLVYHFKDNVLNCHYCNFKMQPPNICPNCNSGYIRYSGIGTEKIESELSRLFPQARIKRLDKQKEIDIKEADIFIATRSIIGQIDYNFSLVGILAIDNSLNRIDFRSAEKTFGLLVGLLGLTDKKIVIQTTLPGHHCFRALENRNINIFYDEEFRLRKQLDFPPYQHLGIIKLRGKKGARVKDISYVLFNKLTRYSKNKNLKIISVNPAWPSKLRGNFYWQILIRSNNAKRISKFLKIHLKDFSHSGIIVTVDIDPL